MLADGTRLAARLWLPVDAEQYPVPALLEYLPYRKNDGTAIRDALRHPYLAGHGYACVRVDMRGSGESDGLLLDEYLKQEQADALEILAWIAAQSWCDGNIGMFGLSWGGFNALQIAARQPPHLKAIITIGFTDDRYADDVHYHGGCVLAYDMLPWASIMLAYNAAPPDPRWVGDRWRAMWLQRLEKSPPYVEAWLSHQWRDAYWKHGSVNEDYAAIRIPVLAVGGWADGYPNPVGRLLAGLTAPRLGLLGPWAHNFPEVGSPGPAIGFLQESLRWWDYWLKGVDTGIMDEPMLRAYIQDSVSPQTYDAERPGRWVAENQWPSPNISSQSHHLNAGLAHSPLDGVLSPTSTSTMPLTLQGLQTTGLQTGPWAPYHMPGEYPADQRADDGQSLCFTSAPVAVPQDILGFPHITLTLSVDVPAAFVAVRLCDVAPDGASTLVSWGVLNLTHRESHEVPAPLAPGQKYTVTFPLKIVGYRLPAGHRWRVALSPNHWPLIWPSPQPVRLTLFAGEGCRLTLPVRAPHPADELLHPFLPAETAPPLNVDVVRSGRMRRDIHTDNVSNRTEVKNTFDFGRVRFNDNGLEVEEVVTDLYSILEGQPLSMKVRCDRILEYQREAWRVRIETTSTMTSDATHFHVTNTLEAYEGPTRVFAKTWTFKVGRASGAAASLSDPVDNKRHG